MEIHDACGCMKCHPEQNTAIGEGTEWGRFGVDAWKEAAQIAYLENTKKSPAAELIVTDDDAPGGN